MALRDQPVMVEETGDTRILCLYGEHDNASASKLEWRLRGAVRSGQPVVVDLTSCRFIDSTSLGLVFHACQSAPVHRFAVAVRPASAVSRLLDLIDFAAVVPVYDTREDAVTAVSNV